MNPFTTKILLLLFLLIIGNSIDAQTVTLEHTYYTDVYDTQMKAPIYTHYLLTKAHLQKVLKRGSTFYKDPNLNKQLQANNNVYKGNKEYDKGHLCPANDFCFDKEAYREAMYYTNTAPQQEYFNEHLWKNVEDATRDTCNKYDSIIVYTGCLYDDTPAYLNGFPAPSYYWKVIVYNHGETAGWLGQNIKPDNNRAITIQHDVADIERRTGLQFVDTRNISYQ